MNVHSARTPRALVLAATALVIAATSIGVVRGHEGDEHDDRGGGPASYTIGLFGDMPYNELGRAQYPNLLADINASHVEFSIFDGDLKAGGDGPCSNELYTTAIHNFNRLERPLIFVPGDNDWTDCWGRYGASQLPFYDPLERLALERMLFASTDWSLGRKKLRLTRESAEGGAFAIYSENVRWTLGPVVYLGLNVQGSNDNYPYPDTDVEGGPTVPVRGAAEIQRQRNEQAARRAANFHWLDEGFAYAREIGAKGVLIVWQADPNFNNEEHQTNPHEWDAYPPYVDKLRSLVEPFDGEVALVHGDSHYFKMDKPLNNSSGGVLANFTRVETFGARNTHWVSARIDAKANNLFTFEPRPVPGNQ
jgi:hypothetical protein